jgi:phosphate transport system substrate-binding protein
MTRSVRVRVLGSALALLWAVGTEATELKGAGATFPAPVYFAWGTAYEKATGIRVAYDPVGSGEGIERIRSHQVDFGASDAPLTEEELQAAGLMQFPAVVGGVVPVINIMGIKPGQLKLSGAVLADIYLGKIGKWNDSRIEALNPGLALPNTNITVVHRSDPSGSTLLWTDFLSRSSPEWQASVGASLKPRWLVGTSGVGNEGVASYVQRTRFALGYVEYVFGRQHHLSDVALQNHEGRFVQASRAAFGSAAAAAVAVGWGSSMSYQQFATDQTGVESWPVTGASFILMSQQGTSTEAVLKFFGWALRHGEAVEQTLDYAPVPKAVVDRLP